MAGYREFQTGEVLTAANVNSFLMEQATMTFADAAARDAALAGVLREGLLTYNLDEGRLEVYDGTDWVEPAPQPPEPPAGIGSNVVQTLKTNVFAESVNAGALGSDITGLTATITPSSATSLVLVMYTLSITNGVLDTRSVGTILRRNGSDIAIGDADGSRRRVTSAAIGARSTAQGNQSATVLDNPETTSPVTYSIRTHNADGSNRVIRVNQSTDDTNETRVNRQVSSITLIEVAA